MKKIEVPSDTAFEQGLSEILSSEIDYDSDDDAEERRQRCNLNFPDTFNAEKKRPIVSELFVRVVAGIAAIVLFIFFVSNISSKF